MLETERGRGQAEAGRERGKGRGKNKGRNRRKGRINLILTCGGFGKKWTLNGERFPEKSGQRRQPSHFIRPCRRTSDHASSFHEKRHFALIFMWTVSLNWKALWRAKWNVWLWVMCCSPFYPLGLSKHLSAGVGTLLASAEWCHTLVKHSSFPKLWANPDSHTFVHKHAMAALLGSGITNMTSVFHFKTCISFPCLN